MDECNQSPLLWEWIDQCPGLAMRVSCLAWQHRGESPVIYVQTFPDTNDANEPRVTAIPRSEWDQMSFYQGLRGNLTVFFGRDGFDAAKQYLVSYAPKHAAGRLTRTSTHPPDV